MRSSDLYNEAVGFCLTGYQLLEEQLKAYLGMHFEITRKILNGRLYFGHEEKDVANYSLERLIGLFAKTCSNAELIRDLRQIISHRNEIAHMAFVVAFAKSIPDSEYVNMASAVSERSGQVSQLLQRVHAELAKLPNALGFGNDT